MSPMAAPHKRPKIKTTKHKCGCISRRYRGRLRPVHWCKKHLPSPMSLIFAAGLLIGIAFGNRMKGKF